MLTALFLAALAVVIYVYFGFPALVGIFAGILNRGIEQKEVTPSVSLIIAAYNEEAVIEQRIDNALSLDYPAGQLEILVASDGSTDGTNEKVRRFAPRVMLLALPRQGKLQTLDEAVRAARGEILVFSDANTYFARDALRKLARNFADPKVGGVAGNKVYSDCPLQESTGRGEQLYWSYDKWLKKMETLTGSTVSADGAIYAIRRNLYQRPLTSAVTDDFAISTAVVEQGERLVFEAEAVAFEEVIETAEREFSRKVRLMTRGLRGVQLRKKLLNPLTYGFYSVILFSHKLLRRLVGFFLLVMLVVSAFGAAGSGFLLAAFSAQVLFYLSALAGFLLRLTPLGKQKVLLIPFFFCLGNLAASCAVFNLLRGTRIERWEPQRHSA